MCFKITWKTHINCMILAVVTTKLLGSIPDEIVGSFLMKNFILYPTWSPIINFYIYILALLIPISCVHEAIHGSFYKAFGGRVKFGFKGIYAYTQEISGIPIQRYKFQIILLTPLLLISLISLALPIWLGGMVFFLNLLGAAGDIYMAGYLLRYKSNYMVVDRSYGFEVFPA